MVFKSSQCDKCVANKTINGKQCKIVWYVDDNKISNVDENITTQVFSELKYHFGDLVISIEKKHVFGWTDIHIRSGNKIETKVKVQLVEVIKNFQQYIGAALTSPAARHILTVEENCEQLRKENNEIFSSVTANLFFITRKDRPGLKSTVAYLFTRVSFINEDDCKKLEIV